MIVQIIKTLCFRVSIFNKIRTAFDAACTKYKKVKYTHLYRVMCSLLYIKSKQIHVYIYIFDQHGYFSSSTLYDNNHYILLPQLIKI